jgi:hypothetical protein
MHEGFLRKRNMAAVFQRLFTLFNASYEIDAIPL